MTSRAARLRPVRDVARPFVQHLHAVHAPPPARPSLSRPRGQSDCQSVGVLTPTCVLSTRSFVSGPLGCRHFLAAGNMGARRFPGFSSEMRVVREGNQGDTA